MSERAVRHDPTLLSAKGARWATCTCGWTSQRWRSAVGAQNDFGRHLLALTTPTEGSDESEEQG